MPSPVTMCARVVAAARLASGFLLMVPHLSGEGGGKGKGKGKKGGREDVRFSPDAAWLDAMLLRAAGGSAGGSAAGWTSHCRATFGVGVRDCRTTADCAAHAAQQCWLTAVAEPK